MSIRAGQERTSINRLTITSTNFPMMEIIPMLTVCLSVTVNRQLRILIRTPVAHKIGQQVTAISTTTTRRVAACGCARFMASELVSEQLAENKRRNYAFTRYIIGVFVYRTSNTCYIIMKAGDLYCYCLFFSLGNTCAQCLTQDRSQSPMCSGNKRIANRELITDRWQDCQSRARQSELVVSQYTVHDITTVNVIL